MKEAYPLAWPEGRMRTLISNRRERNAWKKTFLQYKESLEDELERMGARSIVVTCNMRGSQEGPESKRDPGVAVYFMRPPAEDDFSWQEVLGINHPNPTIREIDDRFYELSKTYHTDNLSTGDLDTFKTINEARRRAKAWVTGDYGKENQFIIECDKYKEVRWNVAAIRIAVNALRKIEECGASGILERAFKGFAAELTEVASGTAASS